MNKNDIRLVLRGKTILITGSTGLVGSALIRRICAINRTENAGIRVLALVRSVEKARRVLGEDAEQVALVVGDVTRPLTLDEPVDFIVHGASVTSSRAFVEKPVETIATALLGTRNMLDLAREKGVESFVYLSSMEVYGAPETDEKITEAHGTNLDTMAARSSYPESKRMCENLCAAYHSEYGVPAKVIRLTQTFGRGVAYDDGRVFAEMARCALEGRDIVLHTDGATKRCYLEVGDAAEAILTVLIRGENGEAYNAANEATYCSIVEMATLVAEKIAGGKIKVRREIADDAAKYGYAPPLKMNLDTEKLRALGWRPTKGLEEMYKELLRDMTDGRGVYGR